MRFLRLLTVLIIIFMLSVSCGVTEGKDLSKEKGNNVLEKTEETKVEVKLEENADSDSDSDSDSDDENTTEPEDSAVTVNPQEVVRKTVVIDPGHANRGNSEKEAIAPGSKELKIKDGGGATGIATGTPEYAINMEVALLLRDILEEAGLNVVLTKTENNVSMGNIDRANVGNENNADLVIRVHCDSNSNTSVKGASMLIPSENGSTAAIYEESKRCGEIVLTTLIEEVGMKNRGIIKRSDLTGFNWSKVPVILIEMGFLSNEEEDKLLSSEAYQQKLASALGKGIIKALK